MAESLGKRVGKWIAFALVLIVAAGGVVAYACRGEISDYFLASSFEPSKRITELQHEIALTPTGDRVFLASQPTIGGRDQFSQWCSEVEHTEQGHVLGCFADRRIRLFEVTDERLQGVVETTAAHELLHAVFTRLSDGDRTALSKKLEREYQVLAEKDPEFKERMSLYEGLSKASFANELHSVLGTEVADLPQDLEEHYAHWLKDRTRIVDWYDSYHSVFTELSQEADGLSAELESLRSDIESRSADYDAAVKQFNLDAADFKARNERYEFSGKEDLFNEIRAELLARQQALEVTVQGIQADIDRFNELRERLIELNGISVELNDVLDSKLPTPSPAPQSEE